MVCSSETSQYLNVVMELLFLRKLPADHFVHSVRMVLKQNEMIQEWIKQLPCTRKRSHLVSTRQKQKQKTKPQRSGNQTKPTHRMAELIPLWLPLFWSIAPAPLFGVKGTMSVCLVQDEALSFAFPVAWRGSHPIRQPGSVFPTVCFPSQSFGDSRAAKWEAESPWSGKIRWNLGLFE